MWDLNLGSARRLLDDYFATYSRMSRVSIGDVSRERAEGLAWNEGAVILSGHGVEVTLGALHREKGIEVSLDGNDDYRLKYLREGRVVAEQDVARCGKRGLCRQVLVVPQKAPAMGFDAIQVFPVRGDERYGLGHLRLLNDAAFAPQAHSE